MKAIARTLLACVFLVGFAGGAAAEDEKELGWFFSAEFAAVVTAGNSRTSTLGLGAAARRVWPKSELKLEAGGIRTESTIKTRTANGTSPDDFVLEEQKTTAKTAENYFARGKYDYMIGKYFTAFGGVDWLRNQFAGIDSRFLMAAGAGNVWRDTDKIRFKTNYSVTYTFEQDVVENPFQKSNFPGVRFSYDFWVVLTESTEFTSDFIVDWNLDNTDDVRIDFTNALPVKITSKLSLKPAVQLLWRNDPALTTVDLTAPADPNVTTVAVPLDELDTIFTLTLVVKI